MELLISRWTFPDVSVGTTFEGSPVVPGLIQFPSKHWPCQQRIAARFGGEKSPLISLGMVPEKTRKG
jgi:hypothetical protein